MAHKEVIYLNRDNTIELGLMVDGAPTNASVVTRAVVTLTDDDAGTVIIDSDTDPTEFNLGTTSRKFADLNTPILELIFGAHTIPARDDYTMTIVLYDATNTNGILWGEPIPVEVKA